jgi:4'-phosphopantetheinyl transferase
MRLDGCTRLQHGVPGDVELWLVDLDAYAVDVALDGLAADEHARAAHMVFKQDAQRYLASRHALRRVLANALERPVESLAIAVDEAGKPHLADEPTVQFNLSHSAHAALIGIGRREAIGVDIEIIRQVRDWHALAQTHFTEGERAELARAGTLSDAAFLACWTRKEACLKALGVGLAAQPITIDAGCAARMRRISVPIGQQKCAVTVYSVNTPIEAVAAVALAAPADAMQSRLCLERR